MVSVISVRALRVLAYHLGKVEGKEGNANLARRLDFEGHTVGSNPSVGT